ncbi:HVA22 homologue C [Prunus dulcis]|uniref:HVA22-like protein n=1 Tax=Prunus dulcis TaxID=3755 RepID=A0A4Y1QQW5_PRUDU|nr:HVA22 homologue C [Prunus dulcis]
MKRKYKMETLLSTKPEIQKIEPDRRTKIPLQQDMGRNNSGNSNNFLQVVASNFDVLALPLITLVYPLYASIKAIETKSRTDDQQWLTYWVLYSLMTIFELTFAKVLEWLAAYLVGFPIWPYAKLIFTCWLVLPQFNGAAYVYRHFIRPYYMNPPSPHQMWYIPRKKNIFSKPDDVLTAAEKYMEEHGTEAFERLITKADREARSRKSHNYMIFDDDYMY